MAHIRRGRPTKRCPRGTWEVAYRTPGAGTRVRTKGGFKTREHAEEWLADFEQRTRARIYLDGEAGKIIFREAGDDRIEWSKPVRHRAFYDRQYRLAARRAGLAGTRFHDLRHTYASLLIAQGEHPKKISAWMGPFNISTTMDRYGHLFDDDNQEAMAALDATFRAADARPSNVVDIARRRPAR